MLREAGAALDVLVASAKPTPASATRAATSTLRRGTSCARKAPAVERSSPAADSRLAPLPGPVVDAYGAGDAFAAGLTYGLAAGCRIEEALRLRAAAAPLLLRAAARTTAN